MFILLSIELTAQELLPIYTGENISIRGLSVVDDQTIWVSGTQGKVGVSTDAGKTWKFQQLKGFEKTDFRDVEGFDARTAIIMGIDSPGVVFKTIDGGNHWKLVYREDLSGVFMDAMEFWKDGHGMIVGDPIKQNPYILKTSDWGDTWKRDETALPMFQEGESMFASSGTNIRGMHAQKPVVITGGKYSRLFLNHKWYELPLVQGQTSTGANSIAISKNKYIVVGGDFTRDTVRSGNAAISEKGKKWHIPTTPPFGYRSCVEFIGPNKWITCGTSGVDLSYDNGENWTNISKEGFHVVRKAKTGGAVYLAGSKGRMAILKQ